MTEEQRPVSVGNDDSRRDFRRYSLIVIGLITILVITYFAAFALFGSGESNDDNRQPVVVQRGTLIQSVSASGTVTFPEIESLNFETSGNVGQIHVAEGDEVTEGQILAELDPVTIANLEAALVNAELSVQDASEALAELLAGASSLERATAESNLAEARLASLKAAEAMEEFTVNGDNENPATIAANAALADANYELERAIAEADKSSQLNDELIIGAQQSFADYDSEYQSGLIGWFGIDVPEEDLSLSPAQLFEKWDTAIDQIFLESLSSQKSPENNPDTPWNEAVVWIWTHLTPYPVITGCDETSPDYQFRCPSAELDDAWEARDAASDLLAETIDLAATDAIAQQKLVESARDAVEDAVSAVLDSTNEIEIAVLVADLNKKRELEIEAESTVAELDKLDALEIKLATAAINTASAQYDSAVNILESAVLSAPFDGIVSSVAVSVGDSVTRNTPVVSVLDPQVITVEGSIDEIDALQVAVGDSVDITVDALPGQLLSGVIQEIGDGVNQQGIVEFPLTILVSLPEDVSLIEGLSATSTLVLNQIDNALLAPLQAVGGSFNQPTMDVITDDGIVTTEVSLGASNDFWVVVESGLVENQQVMMTVADEAVDPFEQFFGRSGAIRGGPGGFDGGGGRIPGGVGR